MSLRVRAGEPADLDLLAAFTAFGELAAGRPDGDPVVGARQLLLAEQDGAPVARASLWMSEDLAGAPGRSGLIGHYEALHGGAGTALLRQGCAWLGQAGCLRVLGPMNGGTWRRYRLELSREPGDPDIRPDGFAGEPRNPVRYAADFSAAGFEVAARYESRFEPEARVDPSMHAAARERANARGVRLHAMDPARFEQTLADMHALSLEAFAANAWYAPLPLQEFMSLYAPFRERAVPSLVRLATAANGELAGYLFGYPDPLSLVDGRPTRIVCKTVAVSPRARGMGLGALLLEDFRAAGADLGLRGVIHALMHVDNASMRMSARLDSVLFKRYALFGRTP